MLGYPKMKGQLEDAVKALDFEHVVILRPGLIVGERASYDSRAAEYVLRKTAELAGSASNKLKDFWAQDASVIAKAAVRAGFDALEGKQKEKSIILGQAGEQMEWFDGLRHKKCANVGVDIVRLGRTEWKD